MGTCPKCGFDRQPEHDECPKCGIVYEKYLKVVKHQEVQIKSPGRKPITKKDKIALFAVISFIGLIIAILVFNTIIKNMRIQREREAREREKEKIIETFGASSEEILNQLESLIDQGKLALAEKEINKFDIPVLREVYPEIRSLKQRIYVEKIKNEPRSNFKTSTPNADTKVNPIDLCVCAMLRTLRNENHNDGRCDVCGKEGGFIDDVKRKYLCGRTYELHSKCAGVILDKCEGL